MGVVRWVGDGGRLSMLLARFQTAASWSDGIAAASHSAVGTCGTGAFRVVFLGVLICVCGEAVFVLPQCS